MRVLIVGGGPAGLYFALLMKQLDPAHAVTILERDGPDDTFGWGIVFSDQTFDYLRESDRPSYEAITAACQKWDNVDIVHRGEKVTVRGNRFSGIARLKFLQILHQRCLELGVDLRFRTLVSDPDLSSLPAADLLVGADGANSMVRRTRAEVFGPTVGQGHNKYIWLGTSRLFHGLTLTFVEHPTGLFIAHSYKFDDRTSTFIVECSEEAWRAAGLDRMTDVETCRFLERVFTAHLDGRPLLTNNFVRWLNFPLVRNDRWHGGDVVLLGDALHTAHFSIGSGTKLALEDAIALASAFRREADPRSALPLFERERRPKVEQTQLAAQESLRWFEEAGTRMHLDPLRFAVEAMTRSKKIDYEKLKRLCQWAWERSVFHRRRWEAARFHPDQLKSVDDIRRIPFMTREEWMDAQMEAPPFGTLTTVDRDVAIRYHMTSGTTGRTALRVLDSAKDWEWIAEMWAYGLWGFGLRPSDVVLFAFSYGTFIGFWGAHYACEKIGCLVLPSGSATTEGRVRTIVDMGVTAVCSTPTYALRMWQAAAEMGIDLARDSKVENVIVSGEPAGSIPAVKRQLEAAWGAKVGDTAGMTEIGTIMIFECARQPGGTHIIEDNFIEETIEHDGEAVVPYGERSERVVTSFGRGFIPLIRYRTKDLVVKIPHTACGCGRTGDLYEGGIQGRWDDMKLVRGTNVYPRAVESIVRECTAVDEFQILLTREGLQDEITVLVEMKPGREDHWPVLHGRLVRDLPDAHEGLRFNVRLAEPHSLPRFELKARRLVDKRPVATYS